MAWGRKKQMIVDDDQTSANNDLIDTQFKHPPKNLIFEKSNRKNWRLVEVKQIVLVNDATGEHFENWEQVAEYLNSISN